MNSDTSKDQYVAQDETYCSSLYRRGLLEQQKEWVSNQIIPVLSPSLNTPSYRVLAVGSGEGDVDMLLLDEINKELIKNNIKCDISYTVIERNASFIARFQDRVKSKEALMKNVSFTFHEGTFEEVTNKDKDLGKFDLVHFIHALYYIDAENALEFCMANLVAPGGCIMSVVQTEESIYAKNCRKYKGKIPNCFDGFTVMTDQTLKPIAAKNNWKCKVVIGKRILDLTDILGESASNEGNKLLDFFFHAEDLHKSLSEDDLKGILDHFKAHSTIEEGKYKSVGHEAIVLFLKDH